jgi:hypothetical protein
MGKFLNLNVRYLFEIDGDVTEVLLGNMDK